MHHRHSYSVSEQLHCIAGHHLCGRCDLARLGLLGVCLLAPLYLLLLLLLFLELLLLLLYYLPPAARL